MHTLMDAYMHMHSLMIRTPPPPPPAQTLKMAKAGDIIKGLLFTFFSLFFFSFSIFFPFVVSQTLKLAKAGDVLKGLMLSTGPEDDRHVHACIH